MIIEKIILVCQVIVSILLVASILLQQRGSGLGGAFGGGGGSDGIYYQKRGIEKVLFYATMVLSVGFVALVLTGLFIS